MKTPSSRVIADRIVVLLPQANTSPLPKSDRLSKSETRAIAQAISSQFLFYAAQYDTNKYWPHVYEQVRQAFRQPSRVGAATLRDAILWKYGHLGKPAIPSAHEHLIAQLQRGWSALATTLPSDPDEAFAALDREFGSKTRFITVAYLLHLLHPSKVPIIDQHNFRAVNALIAGVRPAWRVKKNPSTYSDLRLVAAFIKDVQAALCRLAPDLSSTERELDKFLMMYGKAIK